jgi:hypothetical protein
VSLHRGISLRATVVLLAAVAFSFFGFLGGSAGATSSCSLYASPGAGGGDGSVGSPFGSAQALVDALTPGQTGCLEGGSYDLSGGSSGPQLRFSHGGSSGAPVTLMSAPGATATLTGGIVYVPHGSDFVTISGVHVDVRNAGEPVVQIMGAYDTFSGSDVTNHNTEYSCIIIGSDTGYGQASHTVIEGNVVHQCGYNPSDPYEDHGVYVDNSVDATILNNVFWGMPYGWGVQIYPHAQGTQVLHNVIDDNGQGVVFGGNSSWTSSNNTVAYNIISNSSNAYNIQDWWGGAVGSNNLAKDNCLFHGGQGEVMAPQGFTTSGNVTADPGYSDPSNHNYTLKSGSPCLSVVGYDTAALVRSGGQAVAGAAGAGHHHHHRRHHHRRHHHRRHHRRRHSRRHHQHMTVVSWSAAPLF